MDGPFRNLLAALATKKGEIKQLKEENERLRTALGAVIAANPDAPKSKAFPFLKLPAESRETIYELCLVKGTVYLTPRPTYDHRYNGIQPFENPTWALLAVNREVREEAAKILLMNNHFVLSYDKTSREIFWSNRTESQQRSWGDMFGRPRPDLRRMLPGLVRSHLKSISITFDLRNIANDAIAAAQMAQGVSASRPNMTSDQNILSAHLQFSQSTMEWVALSRFFMVMEYVEIDVTNAYCPLGCHRYIEEAASAIQSALECCCIPGTFVLLGTKNKAERAQIRASVRAGLRRSYASHGKQERAGMLRFQTPKCAGICSGLHVLGRDFQLVDEEVGYKALMSSHNIRSSGERATIASS